ncbi:uncharacterized protein LOC144285133 [Canis aureus]
MHPPTANGLAAREGGIADVRLKTGSVKPKLGVTGHHLSHVLEGQATRNPSPKQTDLSLQNVGLMAASHDQLGPDTPLRPQKGKKPKTAGLALRVPRPEEEDRRETNTKWLESDLQPESRKIRSRSSVSTQGQAGVTGVCQMLQMPVCSAVLAHPLAAPAPGETMAFIGSLEALLGGKTQTIPDRHNGFSGVKPGKTGVSCLNPGTRIQCSPSSGSLGWRHLLLEDVLLLPAHLWGLWLPGTPGVRLDHCCRHWFQHRYQGIRAVIRRRRQSSTRDVGREREEGVICSTASRSREVPCTANGGQRVLKGSGASAWRGHRIVPKKLSQTELLEYKVRQLLLALQCRDVTYIFSFLEDYHEFATTDEVLDLLFTERAPAPPQPRAVPPAAGEAGDGVSFPASGCSPAWSRVPQGLGGSWRAALGPACGGSARGAVPVLSSHPPPRDQAFASSPPSPES